MNEMYSLPEDKEFVTMIHNRAQTLAIELNDLMHKQKQLEVQIERTKVYAEELNNILKREGHNPVFIREQGVASSVGKPGNRVAGMPVRKAEWEGMTINEIVQKILNASPDKIYDNKELAQLVYEIQSNSDLRMVIKNFRSMLQRGAKTGLWNKVGRGQFKARLKSLIEQVIPMNMDKLSQG